MWLKIQENIPKNMFSEPEFFSVLLISENTSNSLLGITSKCFDTLKVW